MKILVINNGSSSVKYKLFESDGWAVEVSGALERIGEEKSRMTRRVLSPDGNEREEVKELRIGNHRAGMMEMAGALSESGMRLGAIGHRVVHGGESFKRPAVIDRRVLEAIRKNVPLAPLHNPANLAGIETALEIFPGVPQVAVFDTAFHQTIPERAFRYCIPKIFYIENGVRRYGFHGTSHQYVAGEAAAFLGREPSGAGLITIHLGNGASMAAVKGGECMDTSMGMTPLEGLCMGTRCGELDPGVVFYMSGHLGMGLEEIDVLLNRESGLKGLCGVNDMREVLERRRGGDTDAALAVDIYTYRVRKYIGAYMAALGGADALVFTGGIGEKSPEIRALCCEGLDFLGIKIDSGANGTAGGTPAAIQAADSRVKILVIPTDEELEIARQTLGAAAGK